MFFPLVITSTLLTEAVTGSNPSTASWNMFLLIRSTGLPSTASTTISLATL